LWLVLRRDPDSSYPGEERLFNLMRSIIWLCRQ
jgi:hypothetical protein